MILYCVWDLSFDAQCPRAAGQPDKNNATLKQRPYQMSKLHVNGEQDVTQKYMHVHVSIV